MKYHSTLLYRRKLLESYSVSESTSNMSLFNNIYSANSATSINERGEYSDSTSSTPANKTKRIVKKRNKLNKSDGDMKHDEGHSPPLDILFPDDLEKFRMEIQSLKKEKVSLCKALQSSEEKYDLLKLELDTNVGFRNPVTGAQLATSKIVELSKKIRELTADLGASKLQCKQLENVVKKFSAIHESNISAEGEENVGTATLQSCGDGKSCASVEDQKKLKKQLESLQLKLFRSRSDNEKLKSQLDGAYKVIEREVGKEVEAVMEQLQDGDYKGRAEQIAELKNKVAELTEKLETRQSSFLVNRNKVDALKAKEKDMKTEHHREIQELKSQLKECKKSNAGAKARYHVLECELKDERSKLKILIEKSNTDEEIIEILKKKVNIYSDEKLKEQELKKEHEQQMSELTIELEQMKTKCNQIAKALEERDNRLKLQEENILYLNSTRHCDAVVIDGEDKSNDTNVEERDNSLDSLKLDNNAEETSKHEQGPEPMTQTEKILDEIKPKKRNTPHMKSKLPSRQLKH